MSPRLRLIERFGKLVEFPLGLVFGVAVLLLELPGELVPPAGDDDEVVVCQLTPLLLDLARDLLPVALQLVPIHETPPGERASNASIRTGDKTAKLVPRRARHGRDMPTKLPSFSRDRAHRNAPTSGLS